MSKYVKEADRPRKYWILRPAAAEWEEVTLREFMDAQVMAGFRMDAGPWPQATGEAGFTGGGWCGRVEYLDIPPETPTLDKRKQVAELSQQIGEFLDWMQDQGISLYEWHEQETNKCYPCDGSGRNPDWDHKNPFEEPCSTCRKPGQNRGVGTGVVITRGGKWPIRQSFDDLLHEYFEIDPVEEEEETRAVLGFVQEQGRLREEAT